MIPEIYDIGDGIEIRFNFENGLSISALMEDDAARDMVNIIDNKLNARGK